MSEDASLFFLERVLRVTHSHIAHRASPPTRFDPWTNNDKRSEAYRKYVGYVVTNAETEEVAYCYLVPDFETILPQINVHYGPAGDPALDPIVARLGVDWHGHS